MQRFDVWGVPLHDFSEDELCARLSVVRGMVITPNPEILLAARANVEYQSTLQRAVLGLPDGIATEFAVAALHDHLALRRHPGVDVIPMLCAIAQERHETLVIIGGFAHDHESIQARLRADYPNLAVHCIDPGMLDDDVSTVDRSIIDTVRALGPSIALVALGQGKGRVQGKQERIAQFIIDSCANVRLAIGIGGSIDVLSGRVDRGPAVLRRFGFEWAWRLVRDPWRFRRMWRAVIVFPAFVAWDTLRNKRFCRALRSVAQDLFVHFTRPAV